jgi:hypothetical protein
MAAEPIYCSYQVVVYRVSTSLGFLDSANLDPRWVPICAHAIKDASAELRRIFANKGYPVSEIGSWDDCPNYCERLGAYFAFVAGTSLGGYDLKSMEYLDCRKELIEGGNLIIGGVATAPSAFQSQVGGVSYGVLRAIREDARRFDRMGGGFGYGYGDEWR